jgi:hypothetical protein
VKIQKGMLNRNRAAGRVGRLKPHERGPNTVKKYFINLVVNFKMDHFETGHKNSGGQTREEERCLLNMKTTPTIGLEKGASL